MKLENRLGIYLVVSICIILSGYALLMLPAKYVITEILEGTIGLKRLLIILTTKVTGFIISLSGIIMWEKHFTSKI
jgi:hypothetical protein